MSFASLRLREKIVEETHVAVYKCSTEQGVNAILKVDLSSQSRGDTEREAEFLRHLKDVPNVRQLISVVESNNEVGILLEDTNSGESCTLTSLCGRRDVQQWLDVAVQLANGLRGIHGCHIIHHDIKADNVIVDPQSGLVAYIDFGLSKRFEDNTVVTSLRGTAQYVSPEATGRSGVQPTFQTDFYSLGIVLYQLWCGRTPFSQLRGGALLQAHFALVPPPLITCPAPIVAVLDKLLMKNATDRYKSASCLLSDLEYLQEAVRRDPDALQSLPFVAGEHDSFEVLHFSDRLYSRDTELKLLSELLQQPHPPALLVSGPSGMGKTALVQRTVEMVSKAYSERSTLFLRGKYDLFERARPYTAIIDAFNGAVLRLMMESAAANTVLKADITHALGVDARVVTDVLPDLERFLGPQQQAVKSLPPAETELRFNNLFVAFASALAAHRSLVVFLDDMQWADLSSLSLLAMLLRAPRCSILWVFAFRDNEVSPTHPFQALLDHLATDHIPTFPVVLSSLTVAGIADLLHDCFQLDGNEVLPLARLLLKRTAGNPFYLRRLLRSLCDLGVFRFDGGSRRWTYEAEEVERTAYADNVVEFMAKTIQTLSPEVQDTLLYAACCGNVFSLTVVADAANCDVTDVREHITVARGVDLVRKSSNPGASLDDYVFVHDRIHEAASAQASESVTNERHLRIGHVLYAQHRAFPHVAPPEDAQLAPHLFAVASQFVPGARCVRSDEERLLVAQLVAAAAVRAKANAAMTAACAFFEAGMVALGPTLCWQDELYELTASLALGLGEALLTTKQDERAEDTLAAAKSHLKTAAHRLRCAFLREELTMRGKNLEKGMAISLEVLAPLIPEFTLEPTEEQHRGLMAQIDQYCVDEGFSPQDVLCFSTDEDPELLHLCALIYLTGVHAMFTMPMVNTMCNMIALLCNLRARKITDTTALLFSAYPIVLDGFGRSREGAQWCLGGKLLAEARGAQSMFDVRAIMAYTVLGAVRLECPHDTPDKGWVDHRTCFMAGDRLYASYTLHNILETGLLTGRPMSVLEKDCEKGLAFCSEYGFEMMRGVCAGVLAVVHYLQGKTSGPLCFDSGSFVEEDYEREWADVQFGFSFFVLTKGVALCVMSQFEAAVSVLRQAVQLLKFQAAFFAPLVVHLWLGTALAGLILGTPDGEARSSLEEEFRASRELAAQGAQDNIAYLSHMPTFLDAVLADLNHDYLTALQLYDVAYTEAVAHKAFLDAALAREWHAACMRRCGQPSAMLFVLSSAMHEYTSLGMLFKTNTLMAAYPGLIAARRQDVSPSQNANASPSRPASPSRATTSQDVDAEAIAKAARSLSSEIDFDALRVKLVNIIAENTGAEHAVLLLASEDGEAEGAGDAFTVSTTLSVDHPVLSPDTPLSEYSEIAHSVVRVVSTTRRMVIVFDASEGEYSLDEHVRQCGVKSILCAPIADHSQLFGVVYLENRLARHAFTQQRTEVLGMLTQQIIVSLQNAQLYRQLKGSLQFSDSVLDNMTDGLLVVQADYCVVKTNHSFLALFGLCEPDVHRRSLFQLLDGALATTTVREALDSVLSDAQTVAGIEVSAHHLLLKLSLSPMDDSGRAAIMTVQDMTEMKKALELERVAQDLARFVADTNVPLFGTDCDGVIQEWNKRMADVSGYDHDEVVGKLFIDAMLDSDHSFYRETIGRALSQAARNFEVENIPFLLFTKNKRHVDALLSMSPRVDSDGVVVGIMGFCMDATEKVREESSSKKQLLLELCAFLPRLVVDTYSRDVNLPEQAAAYTAFDAAVLFVDMSGFTTVTERLMQESREGAEQIGAMLCSAFDTLIPIIHANGGDVVKFAGDAIFAVFPVVEDEAATSNSGQSQSNTPKSPYQRRKTPFSSPTSPLLSPQGQGLHSATTTKAPETAHESSTTPTTTAPPPTASPQCPTDTRERMHLNPISVSVPAASALPPSPSPSPGQAAATTRDKLRDVTLQAVRCGLTLIAAARNGALQFELKVGIGAGLLTGLHLGGVGGAWEYLTVGPALLQMAAAEKQASCGEVVLSSEAWALVEPVCRGEVFDVDDAQFVRVFELLQQVPSRPAPPADISVNMERALQAYVCKEVQRYLYVGQMFWLTELRKITTVFMAIGGISHSHPELSAHSVQQLQRTFTVVQTALARYHGSISKFLVDDKGLILHAAFGLPTATHYNDPTRALLCFVEIRARLNAIAVHVRVGVTTGLAFSGVVGTSNRREFTQHADVVNTSARLMSIAQPNEILCDRATCEASLVDVVSFEELPPRQLKGKTLKVELLRVLEARALEGHVPNLLAKVYRATSSPSPVSEQPFAAEVAHATLLVHEFASAAPAAGHGGGTLVMLHAPLRPSLDYLTALVARAARASQLVVCTAWSAELPPPLQDLWPLLADTHAEDRLAGLPALLSACAGLAPHVVFFDTVVDARALKFLDCLAEHLPSTLLVFVVVRAGSHLPPGAVPRAQCITLDADSEERRGEVRAVVRQRLRDRDDEVVECVVAQSDGDPVTAELLAMSFMAFGASSVPSPSLFPLSDALGTGPNVTSVVDAAVAEQLDSLSVSEQALLKVGAVVGREFLWILLRHVLDSIAMNSGSAYEDLKALQRRRILGRTTRPGSTHPMFYFKSSLLHSVAYSMVPYSQRKMIHRECAMWFEKVLTPETTTNQDHLLLAEHWHRADEPLKEIHFLVLSGQVAQSDAEEFLRQQAALSSKMALLEHQRQALMSDVRNCNLRKKLVSDSPLCLTLPSPTFSSPLQSGTPRRTPGTPASPHPVKLHSIPDTT